VKAQLTLRVGVEVEGERSAGTLAFLQRSCCLN